MNYFIIPADLPRTSFIKQETKRINKSIKEKPGKTCILRTPDRPKTDMGPSLGQAGWPPRRGNDNRLRKVWPFSHTIDTIRANNITVFLEPHCNLPLQVHYFSLKQKHWISEHEDQRPHNPDPRNGASNVESHDYRAFFFSLFFFFSAELEL